MTLSSVAVALAQTFAAVPGVLTVQRDDEVLLGKPSGVRPEPDVCPLVRIGRSRRMPARERGMTLAGKRQRRMPLEVNVWAYRNDAATDADAFLDFVDSLAGAVRRNYTLGGQADTPTTSLLQVRVTEDAGAARPLNTPAVPDGQPLLHATFWVEAWEEVRA